MKCHATLLDLTIPCIIWRAMKLSFFRSCGCNHLINFQVVLTARIHRKYVSMACHFLDVHLSGQMQHSWLRSHLRISILSISMDLLLDLNFRYFFPVLYSFFLYLFFCAVSCSFVFLSTQIVKSEENNHMDHIVPLPVKQQQFLYCYN